MEQAMIPIRVSRLSDWKIYGSQWGHLRSTLDRCGVFFCRAGEVVLEIDNTPYIIQPGDICFYVASALVRVLRVGGETDGVVVEVDVDYILPISNKVLNVQDILFMRDHPCITLTDALCRYVDKLLELYMRRIKEGDGQVGSSKCRSLKVELIKAGGQALFYELLMIYYKEIAARLNFCTQSFFGKYFKQYVGMSPKEYRERSFYPREEVVFDNQ